MADKIVTYNGKMIAGPSGTGMVIVPEKGCKIGDDIWDIRCINYIDPCMTDYTSYLENKWRLDGDMLGYAIVNGMVLYSIEAIKYLADNQDTLFPGWHIATSTELHNLGDYVATLSDWDPLAGTGPRDFNLYEIPDGKWFSSSNDQWNDMGGWFAESTIGGETEQIQLMWSYSPGSNTYYIEYNAGTLNSDNALIPVRLVKNK